MMLGYKIFDANWRCRGRQYAVGRTEHAPITAGRAGLHMSRHAVDCLRWCSLCPTQRYAEVRAVGAVAVSDYRVITDALLVVRELTRAEFRKLCTGTIDETLSGRPVITTYRGGRRTELRRMGPGVEERMLFTAGRREYLRYGPHRQLVGRTVYCAGRTVLIEIYTSGRLHQAFRFTPTGRETHVWDAAGRYTARLFETAHGFHGPQTVWHAGRTLEHATFHQGVRHGPYQIYDPSGQLRDHSMYDHGQKIIACSRY